MRTGRLALRPVGMGDHAALLAHWTGPLVRRHLFGDRRVSAGQVTEIIAASRRDFAARGYGLWTLRPAFGAERLVGVAGLTGPDASGEVEMVYSLEPDRWGQGLAAEAGRAVLGHAFAVAGLRRVTAEIDMANASSLGVAEQLGMRHRGMGPGGTAIFVIDRTQWIGTRSDRPIRQQNPSPEML
ncbi:GNAT family N-acetyltransferase [Actinomadura rupiterrae]|uniref:GNAT family N-acetyltransferase n=1 Tax=Actinomadura rupiterrae TaxID=559627 RepID=UPI0020A3F692|nr:GNAT family N-acetyltransferase [Actinomadura rupiterrae]MCP2341213.1 RimJ/RimL family protein N-acetyltransferase [Actinomadura rupiterrae]